MGKVAPCGGYVKPHPEPVSAVNSRKNKKDKNDKSILRRIQVNKKTYKLVGKFVNELKNNNAHWVGSTNQRVIDVKKSLETNSVVLYK